MPQALFTQPLIVSSVAPRRIAIILTVNQAIGFLFDNWSGQASELWLAAMNTCQNAEEGFCTTSAAREGFVTAVRAAGMQVDQKISLH